MFIMNMRPVHNTTRGRGKHLLSRGLNIYRRQRVFSTDVDMCAHSGSPQNIQSSLRQLLLTCPETVLTTATCPASSRELCGSLWWLAGFINESHLHIPVDLCMLAPFMRV